MASLQLNDVFYGNPGLARYDAERLEWLFQRRAEDAGSGPQVVWNSSEDSKDDASRASTSDAAYYKQREKQIRNFIRSEPEIIPEARSLFHLSQVSEALESLSPSSDPLASDLVAVGVAGVYGRYKTREEWPSVRIIASVSGVSRHSVRLALLKSDLHMYQAYPDFGVDIFAIDLNEPAWYVGASAPVQQLCFSSFIGLLGGFLAVRRLHGTSILHPALRLSRVHRPPLKHNRVQSELNILGETLGRSEQYPPSQLDPNFLLTISTEDTGGACHVDVTFNPWYQRQVAIIDSIGYLRTFTVVGPHRSPPWSLQKGPSVEIEPSTDVEENDDFKSDKWAVVLWAGDETTLVASTRRLLKVFQLEDTKITPLMAPGIARGHESEWILDVKRSDSNSSELFVLTSSHVIWLRVLTRTERETTHEREVGTRVILSSCHYRSTTDRSMRLTINGTGHGATLLIYSRETGFTTGLTFCHEAGKPDHGYVSDPYHIPLTSLSALDKAPLDSAFPPTQISVLAASLHSLNNCPISDTDGADDALEGLPPMQQLFYIGEDYTIKSLVYVGSDAVRRHELPSLKYIRTRQESRKKVPKHGKYVEESYFIVPDDAILAGDLEPSNETRQQSSAVQSTAARDSTSLDNLRVLLDRLSSELSNSHQVPKSFSSYEELAERILSGSDKMLPGFHTLADLVATEFLPDDIDKIAQITQELLDNINERPTNSDTLGGSELDISQRFRTLPLSTIETMRSLQSSMHNERGVLLIPLYEQLLDKWLHPLTSEAPPELRVWQESILRQIMMDLFLASHGIRMISQDASLTSYHEPHQSQSVELALPVRGKSLPNQRNATERQRMQSQSQQSSNQAGPSSSASGTSLALPNQSSLDSSSLSQTDTRQPPGYVLGQYCIFKRQKALPKSLQKVADEWEIGADPANFHWREDKQDENTPEGGQEKNKKQDQERAARQENAGPSQPEPSSNLAWRSQTQSLPGVTSNTSISQNAVMLGALDAPRASQATMGSQKPTKKPKKRVREGF